MALNGDANISSPNKAIAAAAAGYRRSSGGHPGRGSGLFGGVTDSAMQRYLGPAHPAVRSQLVKSMAVWPAGPMQPACAWASRR